MARRRKGRKSKRKTFKTKSAAKKRCKRGVYKVKGGWRCSIKRRR